MTYPKVREGFTRMSFTLILPKEIADAFENERRRKAKKRTELVRDIIIYYIENKLKS